MSNGSRPPRPEDFLLPAQKEDDSMLFLPAGRMQTPVEMFVDATEAFPAMEAAIWGAQRSVYIAFWIFNPGTPLLDSSVRRAGPKSWGELLRSVAKRGVATRLLLTDFDPLFGDDKHRQCWRSYLEMAREAARLGAKSGLLQVICSRHGATVALGLKDQIKAMRDTRIRTLNRRLASKQRDDALRELRTGPGIWPLVRYDERKKRLAADDGANLLAYPASHHQKVCVVDEQVAFLGGLDVNKGRIDSPRHNGKTSWHDVQCRVEGAAALDVCRNFVSRWNEESELFFEFVKASNERRNAARIPVAALPVAASRDQLTVTATSSPLTGMSTVQIQRTRSVPGMGRVPKNELHQIQDGYEKAIRAARKFIYIENQYVRARELRDWIIRRAAAVDHLNVIIVVPVAPEEVAAPGGMDPITRLGLKLQHDTLAPLKSGLGRRCGIFSLVKRTRGGKSDTDAAGSPQVYVHSKCLLVDDVYASVGSANANPRSFVVDTEITAAVFGPAAALQLRLRLWAEILGSPKDLQDWKPSHFVEKWTEIAAANEKLEPARRRGLVVKHDIDRFKGETDSVGEYLQQQAIPEEFASVFDLEVGGARLA